MASFPTYARVLLAGFGEAAEPGVLRTQMESGPPKQLKVKSRVMVTREVSLHFVSKADYAAFLVFVRTTLHMGADWFTWTDPVDGASKSARLVEGRLGEARPIAGLPGVATSGWVVPCSIETWSA
jgi:hypothetical protein